MLGKEAAPMLSYTSAPPTLENLSTYAIRGRGLTRAMPLLVSLVFLILTGCQTGEGVVLSEQAEATQAAIDAAKVKFNSLPDSPAKEQAAKVLAVAEKAQKTAEEALESAKKNGVAAAAAETAGEIGPYLPGPYGVAVTLVGAALGGYLKKRNDQLKAAEAKNAEAEAQLAKFVAAIQAIDRVQALDEGKKDELRKEMPPASAEVVAKARGKQ